MIKAAKTATQAAKDLKPGSTAVEDAVKSAGVDPARWKTAQDLLYKNGLTEHDLIGGNALENGAFQILRKYLPDIPIAGSVKAAKTANAVLNAGFTYQQLESAAAMSPRFLDALKEGDYDHAMEYGTEALAGGALGVAGAGHAIHSWGELAEPLLSTKLRPSDTTVAVQRTFGDKEAEHAVAEQTAINISQKANALLGHEPVRPILGDTKEVADKKSLERTMATLDVHTGVGGIGSQEKAADWYNALSEAAGKDDRVIAAGQTQASVTSGDAGGGKTLYAVNDPSGTLVGKLTVGDIGDNKVEIKCSSTRVQGQGYGTALYKEAIKAENAKGNTVVSDQTGATSPEAKRVWESLVGQGLAEKVGDTYQAAPRPEGESPVNGQLPQQIATNKFKSQTPEYQSRILDSLKAIATGNVPDNVREAAKYLRSEEAKTAEIGGQTGLIQNFVDDHMTRRYKDENPEGRVVSAEAKSGKFATSVSEARHRVYDSTLTALLKSPKEMLFDPADSTAQGRASLLKAAANKKWIGSILDKGFKDSTGRPVAFLNGAGRVVAGENGEDPRIYIDANRANIRKLNMPDDEIAKLTASGDMQRFLDDGTIKDITPYIRPDNINGAISRLEDQAVRKDAQYDEVGNNKLLTDIMLLKSMANNHDFSGLKAFNDARPKLYAWDPQGYVSLAQDAVKGWNFTTNSPDGAPIYVRSDVQVSPEFAEYFKNRLGLEKSAVANNPIGKALLGTGTKLKETLLSLSPFHMVQEALRGIMIGVNPITAFREALSGDHPNILNGDRVDPNDPNSPSKQYVGVQQGLTVGTDHKAQQASSEGLAAGKDGLISKIPGVGKTVANSMQWYQDFLFKRYIPALKARAYELMFDRYREAHPDWSIDKVAKNAATHTNDTFGGINWKAMGRSATTQDWGRLMLLAPDWLEAEMRSGTRLFNKDEGGLGRAQVAKMAFGLWGVARVLNLVSTGNAHYEAPFGLAIKNKEGKETVFGIRTLPTDLLHAASDPVGFVKGRLSPTVHMGEELMSGRDVYGRKLGPQDLWADVFRNMAPIPAQAIGQAVSGTGPQVGNPGQIWKAGGGTAQTYSTPAQKMAADLAASHSEDGLVDPAQMARHRRVMDLEDQVRAGDVSWPDLVKLTYNTDQLKESELKKIQQNLSKTKDMDSATASLYTRASRLPAKEYLDLYDQMNTGEKTALIPLTQQVMKKYTSKALKDETPTERAKDPVLQRILNMMHPSGTPQASAAPPIPAPVQKEVAYLYTATHPQTGHKVGSPDGQNWFDHQTGEPVNG